MFPFSVFPSLSLSLSLCLSLSPHPQTCQDTARNQPTINQKSGPHQIPDLPAPWTSASRTVRKKSLPFNPLSLWSFVTAAQADWDRGWMYSFIYSASRLALGHGVICKPHYPVIWGSAGPVQEEGRRNGCHVRRIPSLAQDYPSPTCFSLLPSMKNPFF